MISSFTPTASRCSSPAGSRDPRRSSRTSRARAYGAGHHPSERPGDPVHSRGVSPVSGRRRSTEAGLRVVLLGTDIRNRRSERRRRAPTQNGTSGSRTSSTPPESPTPAGVSSTDEIGPIPRVPQGGSARFPKGLPERIPAERRREDGTTGELLMLKVDRRPVLGHVDRTQPSANWLRFLKEERAKYPEEESVHLIPPSCLPTERRLRGRGREGSG